MKHNWLFFLIVQLNANQGFGALVPSDSALEANSSSFAPFSFPPKRMQQVYFAGDLINFDPDAITRFDRLYFRLDTPNGTTLSGFPFDLQIRMSTTTRAVDSLSPVFAENIGVDETVVFSGSVSWSTFHQPSISPQFFDLRIDLQQPFFYQPSMGNLLIDFNVTNSLIQSQIDAWNRLGDSVSSVVGEVGAASGTPSTLGLVTFFDATIVPEPSTYILISLGAAAFLMGRRRRT
jgi:hypothetical protein